MEATSLRSNACKPFSEINNDSRLIPLYRNTFPSPQLSSLKLDVLCHEHVSVLLKLIQSFVLPTACLHCFSDFIGQLPHRMRSIRDASWLTNLALNPADYIAGLLETSADSERWKFTWPSLYWLMRTTGGTLYMSCQPRPTRNNCCSSVGERPVNGVFSILICWIYWAFTLR